MNAAAVLVVALAFGAVEVPEPDVAAGGYAIDRTVIAGGTGASSGGTYRVDGTVGQGDVDASQPAAAGSYDVTGGFWAGVVGGTGDRIFANGFE